MPVSPSASRFLAIALIALAGAANGQGLLKDIKAITTNGSSESTVKPSKRSPSG